MIFVVTSLSDNDPATVLIELATSHHQHGRFEQAFETLFQVAELYRMQEKSAVAAHTFRKLLRLETSDIELQLALVQNFLEMELYEEAVEAFCLCASHFDTLGMLDRFLDLANQLLHIDPDLIEVRNKVIDVLVRDTEIYLSYQLFEQAKLALERALKYFPHSILINKMMLSLIKKTADNSEQLPWLLKLAQLTRDDARTSSQYLSCALTLADDPEEIFIFADSINLDFRRSSSIITCIGDEVTETPTEFSAPKADDDSDESSDEVPTLEEDPDLVETVRPGLSLRQRLTQKLKTIALDSQRELVMLQHLLRIAEECKEATVLNIRAKQPDQGPHAELLAYDGALSVNIRLNDETLSSPTLQSSTNREELRHFIIDALVKIAQAFDGIAFEVHQTMTEQEILRAHLLPSHSIMMALARRFAEHAETSVASQFLDAASALTEQGWLFVKPPPGIELPLPIASIQNIDTSFAALDVFGRALLARDAFLKNLFSQPGEQQKQGPVLTQLIATDTSYACLSYDGYTALVQVEHQKTGQLFQLARQFIGTQDP